MKYTGFDVAISFIYLEHILVKKLFVILAKLFKNDFAELREVDIPIPDDVVGQVDDLLLHGVEAQHLHGRQQILKTTVNQFNLSVTRFI